MSPTHQTCNPSSQVFSALKYILVGYPGAKIRRAFSETFGYDLPQEHLSKLANFLVWNRLSYRRPRNLPDNNCGLRDARQVSFDLWGGLALASADDDADQQRINAEEFAARLRFLLSVIEASFSYNLNGEIKREIPCNLFTSCMMGDFGIHLDSCGNLEILVAKSAPLPHTTELYVNTYGAWLFGCSLSKYMNILHQGGTKPRRLAYILELITSQLKKGAEGQISSIRLVSPEPIPFSTFLSLTQPMSAPIAKILTFLRSPDHIEKLRKHYKRYDPTVFQYVLDDIPDCFEDCLAGKQGIVHGLIFAQSDIAKLVKAAITKCSDCVEVSDLSALNFLREGNWSSASNYVAMSNETRRVKVSDLRPALENRRRDAHLSIEDLVATRIATGERMACSLRTKDTRECGIAVTESGILLKMLSGLRGDQRRINHIEGVTSKLVGLFPLIAALIAAKCYAQAWRYRLGWRVL